MSNINTPNLALTTSEVDLLRIIYVHGNCVTLPELKAEAAKHGIESKAVDSAMSMLHPQGFVVKEPRPRTPGGYIYSITLKSMKKVRAANSAAKASDRQTALVK